MSIEPEFLWFLAGFMVCALGALVALAMDVLAGMFGRAVQGLSRAFWGHPYEGECQCKRERMEGRDAR